MIVTLKDKAQQIVIPPRVKRLAGIKVGDRLEFQVSGRTITITASEPKDVPTKAELAEIRKGECAIAKGESLSLEEFLNGMGDENRKTRPKKGPRLSR